MIRLPPLEDIIEDMLPRRYPRIPRISVREFYEEESRPLPGYEYLATPEDEFYPRRRGRF